MKGNLIIILSSIGTGMSMGTGQVGTYPYLPSSPFFLKKIEYYSYVYLCAVKARIPVKVRVVYARISLFVMST